MRADFDHSVTPFGTASIAGLRSTSGHSYIVQVTAARDIPFTSVPGTVGELVIASYGRMGLVDGLKPLTAGLTIYLVFPLIGWREAQVLWVDHQLAGCGLVRPLSDAEITAIKSANEVLGEWLPDLMLWPLGQAGAKQAGVENRFIDDSVERREKRSNLLTELRMHHTRATTSMAAFGNLLTTDKPDLAKIAIGRMDLVSIGIARSFFIDDVCDHLLDYVTSDGADAIQRMMEKREGLRIQSSRHMAYWTSDGIVSDWDRYQKSSIMIRKLVAEIIVIEMKALYTLLSG